jgi:hypothetical protein
MRDKDSRIQSHLDFLKRKGISPDSTKTSIKSEFPEINPETHNVTKVSKHNIFATYSNNSGITDPWEKDSSWQMDLSGKYLDQILSGIYLNEENSNLSKEEIWGIEEFPLEANSSHWDRAAWYCPIHYFGDDWGIYIKQEAVIKKAARMARFLGPQLIHKLKAGANRHAICCWLVKIATLKYFLHEHFHHKVESLGFRLHTSIGGKSNYLSYKEKVYRPNLYTSKCLEESLANADVYKRVGNEPYRQLIGKSWIAQFRLYLQTVDYPFSPPGYREAGKYLERKKLENAMNIFCGQLKEATLHPIQDSRDWEVATRLCQSMFSFNCPIWEVIPAGSHRLLP